MSDNRDHAVAVMAKMLRAIRDDVDEDRVRLLAEVAADAYLEHAPDVLAEDRSALLVSVREEVARDLSRAAR